MTDLVEADEIGQVLASKPPAEAVHRLVDMARDRGGHDNITVVALKVPATSIPQQDTGCLRQVLIAGIIGFIALASALLISWRVNFWPWNTDLFGGLFGSEDVSSPAPSASQAATDPVEAQGIVSATPTPTPTLGPTSTAIPLATVESSSDG